MHETPPIEDHWAHGRLLPRAGIRESFKDAGGGTYTGARDPAKLGSLRGRRSQPGRRREAESWEFKSPPNPEVGALAAVLEQISVGGAEMLLWVCGRGGGGGDSNAPIKLIQPGPRCRD